MEWIYNDLKMPLIALKEPLLDCMSCNVRQPLKQPEGYSKKTKCCLFKPYWNALSIGRWLKASPSINLLEEQDMVFTSIGILHSLKERADYSLYQNKKLDNIKACHYFHSTTGHCQIWSFRPPTCSNFFCASENPKRGKFYHNHENFLLSLESDLMKQWFFHRQGSDQDWQILVNYFDEDNKRELPERLLLKFHEAMDCYKQCYEWYSRLNKEKLRAQLQNRRDYQLVLEEYSSLC